MLIEPPGYILVSEGHISQVRATLVSASWLSISQSLLAAQPCHAMPNTHIYMHIHAPHCCC